MKLRHLPSTQCHGTTTKLPNSFVDRTNIDATIIGPPSSTKNEDERRGPEMHQTAKGKHQTSG